MTKYLLPAVWLSWTLLESIFVRASEKGQRVNASGEKAHVVRAVIERLTGMSTARRHTCYGVRLATLCAAIYSRGAC